MNEICQILNITKDFPGVRALDNVSLDLRHGEIHALVGENGAGKSTLIKVLAGIITPDKGKILLNNIECKIHNPRIAHKFRIAIVFQELNLVPYLTIEQNIFLSHEPFYIRPIVNNKIANYETRRVLKLLGINIEPNTMLHELSIGQRQMIAIARALSLDPKILLLDEPTSSLSENEIEQLYFCLKELKAKDVSILYVSHRLEEVFRIADRVTVLRDGRKIDTQDIKRTSVNEIIVKIVGRTISNMYPKEAAKIGEETLRLVKLSKKSVCENISLSLRKGEVVGLYGLVGAGRTELARIIFGMDKPDSGEIYLFNKLQNRINPSKSINLRVGYLPEDRKYEGLCMVLSIRQNITRASLRNLFPVGIKSIKKEKSLVLDYISDLHIATPSGERSVAFLSGGNQQKVVFAHWMCAGSEILLLDEPTRGIDVGTKVEIYKMMNQLTMQGKSILLISSDLPELLNMSDRVYVMYRGKITKEFLHSESDPEKIIAYAIGAEKAK